MPPTHPTRKTGRRPVDHDRPAVPFSVLLKAPFNRAALPVHPPAWAPWPGPYDMALNDRIGDCVVAMIDHALSAIAAATGTHRDPWTDEQLIAYYRTQNPDFDPNGSSSTNGPGSNADGGMSEQKFLEHLVAEGTIRAFAKIDHGSLEQLAAATYYGVAACLGVTVDDAQMGHQFDAGLWDYVANSPADGGHAIPVVGWPQLPVAVTWAKLVQLTHTFLAHQCDEAWFILTDELVAHPTFRAELDLQAFADAVAAITDGKVQVTVTPPDPQPTPAPGASGFLPVATDVVPHIASASHRAGLTPAQWLDHHLRTYFRMRPAEVGETLEEQLARLTDLAVHSAGGHGTAGVDMVLERLNAHLATKAVPTDG